MSEIEGNLFEEANTSSDEENPFIDEDICSKNDLDSQFTIKYCISSEEAVSLKHVYGLCLSNNKDFNKIAAGMSNGQVHLFDIQSGNYLNKLHPITPSAKASHISGIQFLDENSLLIGNTNGKISLFDLRTNKKVETYEDNSENTTKLPILCFDVNANSRIICAGTEQVLHDSFLLFFDIRQKNLLGGYEDSHRDDITSVKFHPQNPDLLITGSTDGLINIFDISEKTEDDAIQFTLNTDSSVHKLNWHKNVYNKNIISCITHTNDLQIFDAEEGDQLSLFERSIVTNAIKRKSEGDCNLINCHNLDDDSIFLLAGSNYNKGDILRSLKIFNKNLISLATFQGNKQIVRDSIYDTKTKNLITSGESGIITIWSDNINNSNSMNSSTLKVKSKNEKKTHNLKPY